MRANNRLPGKRQVVRLPRSFDCAVGSPGRPSLASLQEELTNLELARRIELPPDLFDHVSTRDLELCRRRVAVEAPRVGFRPLPQTTRYLGIEVEDAWEIAEKTES